MKIDNYIITDSSGKIAYIGAGALNFTDLKNEHPLCYPSGRIEKGDILIFLSGNQKTIKDVCGIMNIKPKDDFCEIRQLLIISDLYNGDVNPIVETNFIGGEGDWNAIDTIYERTEIIVKGNGNTAQKNTWWENVNLKILRLVTLITWTQKPS